MTKIKQSTVDACEKAFDLWNFALDAKECGDAYAAFVLRVLHDTTKGETAVSDAAWAAIRHAGDAQEALTHASEEVTCALSSINELAGKERRQNND